MDWRLGIALAAVVVVAGCGSATPTPSPVPTSAPTAAPTPTPSPSPTPSPAPTPTSSPVAGDLFEGLPFSLDLPAGWTGFDLSAPGAQAALDAFATENPGLAGAMEGFQALPDARLAVNSLLGNVLVAIPMASQGLSLETIGQSVTAQFGMVPGVTEPSVAEAVTLPAGDALHWTIQLEANKTGGGTVKVAESLYLLVGEETAVMVFLVTPSGGVIPDEPAIMESLEFRR